MPTVTPTESELAILKRHYPASDANSPPWNDIKADLLAAAIPIETVHNASSLDLVRMLDQCAAIRTSSLLVSQKRKNCLDCFAVGAYHRSRFCARQLGILGSGFGRWDRTTLCSQCWSAGCHTFGDNWN